MFLLLLSITVSSRELHLQMNLYNNSVYGDCLYMTTDNGGVVSFDPEDNTWDWVNSFSGLSSNIAKDLFLRGDSIFILTNGGISILDSDLNLIDFQVFNSLFFVADDDPDCISLYKNTIILGGSSGVQWFDLRNFGNLSRVVEHRDYGFQVFEILPLDTCYILGTGRGVYKVDSNFQDTIFIDASGETYSLFVDGASIWAGGSWGCKEITGDTAVFSNDTVWSIDKIDEEIYIGTKNGLYNRYGGVWNRISGGDIRGFVSLIQNDNIISVVRRRGVRFENPYSLKNSPGLISNLVTDLIQTSDGKIYISYKGTRRISMFDGVSWNTLNDENNWNFSGGNLFNIESDSQGRIYFGFWYWEEVPILFCWDTQNDTMPKPIDLPVLATTVTGMFVDSNDDLWAGLLNRFTLNNWVFKAHRETDGSLIWTEYSDPEIVWKRVFAEGSEGVYCGNSPTDGGSGIHILTENGSFEKVTGNFSSSTISMASDLEGNIWAGLEDRLVYISGNSLERVETQERFEGLAVDFQGGLWSYNSMEGLSYLNPEGVWESLPQELTGIKPFGLDDVISPLHFTGDRNLFICTYNGLYEFDLDFDSSDSSEVNVYPNPFNYQEHDRLIFSVSDIGGMSIFIYDIVGNLQGEYHIPSENDGSFWIEKDQIALSSGLYSYFITEEGNIIHQGKFVVIR